ncbi:MAG: hypothetical protein ACI814_003987 [Mariniblastus sp.]
MRLEEWGFVEHAEYGLAPCPNSFSLIIGAKQISPLKIYKTGKCARPTCLSCSDSEKRKSPSPVPKRLVERLVERFGEVVQDTLLRVGNFVAQSKEPTG